MRYSEEIIQNVIDANPIEEVIGQYTALKKSGRSMMGCCPFHNEKTPSFSVSPDKQLYHCFGCGVGGNVIGFIMAIENISFIEAIRLLAERAGIQLPESTDVQNDAETERKNRLYEIHRLSANAYYRLLKQRKDAQQYLSQRGLSAKVIKTFGMGVSNDEWRQIVDYLRKKGFSDDELIDSGMAIKSKDGRLYDRFRNRIMIPIQNNYGKIIGFGGRSFGQQDKHSPKYLNSPETPIFSKGAELFNLNNARKNKTDNRLILVEGYMDVIALYQYGIKNAIAALGTSFTPNHAKTISRYTDELVLCFDGDQAGQKATLRALEILKSMRLNVRAVDLENDEDPDSFIRKYGVDAFITKIDRSETAVGFQIEKLTQQFDLTTIDGKTKFIKAASACLQGIDNQAETEIYVKKIATIGKVSENSILKMLTSGKTDDFPDFEDNEKKIDRYVAAQRYICQSVFFAEDQQVLNKIDCALFIDPTYRKLFETLSKGNQQHMKPSVLIELSDSDADKQLLSELLSEEFQFNPAVLDECIKTLKLSQVRQERISLKKELEIIDDFNAEAGDLARSIVEKKKLSQL